MRENVVVLVRDDGRTERKMASASCRLYTSNRQHSHVCLAAHDGQEGAKVSDGEAVREGEDAKSDDAEKGGSADEERALASLVTEVSRDGGVDGSCGVRRGGEEKRLLDVVSATLQNDGKELSGGQQSASASDEIGIIMLT